MYTILGIKASLLYAIFRSHLKHNFFYSGVFSWSLLRIIFSMGELCFVLAQAFN